MRLSGWMITMVGILGLVSVGVADTYNFAGMTTGGLGGQDNWQSFSNHNNDDASNWSVVAGYAGENIVKRETGLAGSNISFFWRQNDANYSIPTFTGTETGAVLQFSMRETGDSSHGSGFGLGYNPNGVDVSESARNFTNLGPILYAERGSIAIRKAGNSGVIEGAVPVFDNMLDIRLVMDFTANGGDGSGSIYYRDIGWGWDGTGIEWVALESMQNKPLGLLSMSGCDPSDWNAMAIMGSCPPKGHLTNLIVDIPEPGTMVLLALGGLTMLARRKQ